MKRKNIANFNRHSDDLKVLLILSLKCGILFQIRHLQGGDEMAWSVIETILALVAAGVTGTNAVAANAPDFVTNEAAFFVVDIEQEQ